MRQLINLRAVLASICAVCAFTLLLMAFFPPLVSTPIAQDKFVKRGDFDGYYIKVSEIKSASGKSFKSFPLWNESPGNPRRSTIRLSECGQDILPAHDLSENVYNSMGGGFNHRQDHIFFAHSKACRSPLIVKWPSVSSGKYRFGALIFFLVALVLGFPHVRQLGSYLQSKYSSEKLSLFNRRAAFTLAFLILAYYFIVGLSSAPSVVYLRLDSTTWIGAKDIILPYFAWIANSFEWVDFLSGKPGAGYQLFLLLSFFVPLSYLVLILTRTGVAWAAPAVVLLLCGADSISLYWYNLLTEAPSFGLILISIGGLVAMAKWPNMRMMAMMLFFIGFAVAFRSALIFLIPLALLVIINCRLGLKATAFQTAILIGSFFTFYLAVPFMYRGGTASQTGIVLIAATYHLPDDDTVLSEPAQNMRLALKEQRERHETTQLDIVDDAIEHGRNLSEVSIAAQLVIKKKLVADGTYTPEKLNDELELISFEYIRKSPIKYIVHSIRAAYGSMLYTNRAFRYEWLGPSFQKAQLSSRVPIDRFAEEMDQADLLPLFELDKMRGVQVETPRGFDVTNSIVSSRTYLAFYHLLIFYAVIGVFGLLFCKKISRSSSFPSIIVAVGCVGYLLTTAMTASIILRYSIAAEMLLLTFIPLAIAGLLSDGLKIIFRFVGKRKLINEPRKPQGKLINET